MKKTICLALLATIVSCQKSPDFKPSFTSVETDTLLMDSISIRALVIDGDKAWYAGSGGKYGYVSINGSRRFNGIAAKDTLLPEFRSLAQTEADIFILNAGTPALLYRISKDGKRVETVYTESGEKVFYDSMQFSDDKNGMAIGDPIDGCLSIITTNDGGVTWNKIPCSELPAAAEGEAAFAASNTNLVMKGDKAWIASGGKKSRVFYSKEGKKWKVYDTPIVQGSEMTGMFSIDFYDEKIGFAVGGDYEKLDKSTGNKIITTNGGKTWKAVGEGTTGFGYASCVQFVPGSDGDELMTAGPWGIYYSYDRGLTWKKILDSRNFHTLRFIDNKNVIIAGQNLILKLKLN